jgi:hypothetical protein
MVPPEWEKEAQTLLNAEPPRGEVFYVPPDSPEEEFSQDEDASATEAADTTEAADATREEEED